MMLALILAALLSPTQSPVPAANPSRGLVSGNAYSNPDLGITYTFPDGWTAQPFIDRGALDVRFTPSYNDGSDIEMFVLDSSLFPHVTPLRSFRKTDVAAQYALEADMREVTLGGRMFLRTDWVATSSKAKLHQTRLFTEIGAWRLLFFLTAPNRSQVDSAIAGVAKLEFHPTSLTTGPPGPHVVRVLTQDMIKGKLSKRTQPEYPQLAKRGHIQGQVLLEVVIGKDGRISSMVPLGGEPLLVNAAMDAVRQWEYKPFTVDGEPVEVITVITVNFTLGG